MNAQKLGKWAEGLRGDLELDGSDWRAHDRRILASCHPKQQAFAQDPARRIVARVARGGGKTTGGRARFVRRLMQTREASCLYIATTREQAQLLMWEPLKELLDELKIRAKFNETKLWCSLLRNGSRIRLVGADNKRDIEKQRGIPNHEVGIDEMSSYPKDLLEHLLYRILGPRMGDFANSTLWMVGTPGHLLRGPAYEITRTGSPLHRRFEDRNLPEFANWQKWSFHSWNLSDGAEYVPAMRRLWAEAQIEKEANGWTDDNPVWVREYLGQWAADDSEQVFRYRPHTETGEEFNQWDPEIGPGGIAKLPKQFSEWRFVYGIDLGHSDPLAVVIWAYSPEEGILRQVYGLERREMHVRSIAQLLIGPDLDTQNLGGLFGVTGWPDALVADTTHLGGMFLDELRSVYGIRATPAEQKHKHDSIELFNGDLIDGRIKVLKDSSLEAQLVELQWDEDQYGKLRENKTQANHSTDAALYARMAAAHQYKDAQPAAAKPRGDYRNAGSEDDENDDDEDYVDGLLGDSDPWGDGFGY